VWIEQTGHAVKQHGRFFLVHYENGKSKPDSGNRYRLPGDGVFKTGK
jgi:hypothetical protein